VTGHVRRRFFRAGGGTQSRTEVVADAVVPVRSKARARRAIDEAVAKVLEPAAG
jgi:single-strand DNA-binding protein